MTPDALRDYCEARWRELQDGATFPPLNDWLDEIDRQVQLRGEPALSRRDRRRLVLLYPLSKRKWELNREAQATVQRLIDRVAAVQAAVEAGDLTAAETLLKELQS